MRTIQMILATALLAGTTILANADFAAAQAILRDVSETTISDAMVRGEDGHSKKSESGSVPDSMTPERILESGPKLLPFRSPEKPSELDRAYLDVFTILREGNSCSNFFGGSGAIVALNEMVQRVRPTYLDRSVALKMSGPVTTYQSYLTGFSFRMFAKADINVDGPFYRSNGLTSPRIPLVGSFQPNSREARVTVLLHELGHLVRGPNKKWLLPDDGGDAALSHKNTGRILQTCGKQIEEVVRTSVAQELKDTRVELANRVVPER